MSTPVIATEALCFSYNNRHILRNISLAVPAGAIYGFIGKNGSGKTTTIKILLSLLLPRTGSVTLFGKDPVKQYTEILQRTGSLVEQPGLYHHLTGFENLHNRAALLSVNKNRIDEVLTITGLFSDKNIKVKNYSQGMKQRLGIALALLHAPELLILDEPINNLDPAGKWEMRELMRDLVLRCGKTIFISSHLLDELEKTITHAGILHEGELVFHGLLNELKEKEHASTLFRTSDDQKAVNLLVSKGFRGIQRDSGIEIGQCTDEITGNLNKLLVDNGISIYTIEKKEKRLEDIYLNLISLPGELPTEKHTI